MNILERIKAWAGKTDQPLAHRHGALGEQSAKKHLRRLGLKFLAANFRSSRGEIDLIFQDKDCFVFVWATTFSNCKGWNRCVAYDRWFS